MLQIPLRTDLTNYDLQVELDGVTYTLSFLWNTRASAWFLDILDAQGEAMLVAGIRAVVDWNLLLYRNGGPPGALIAYDSSGAGQEAGINDLGDRVMLLYVPAAEVAAILAAA